MTNPLPFHKREFPNPHCFRRRMRAVILGRRPGEAVVRRMIAPAISGAAFMGALARSPRTIGACVPSSKMLSRMMAAEVPLPVDGVVIELGGGTGRITSALLERGVPPEQLVVVEQNPSLADLLRKRFSKVQVIQGDAAFCYSQIPGSRGFMPWSPDCPCFHFRRWSWKTLFVRSTPCSPPMPFSFSLPIV